MTHPDELVTVTMPRSVARALERLLGAHLLAAYRKTGGTASPDAEQTLRALRDAAQGRLGFAPEPTPPPPVKIGAEGSQRLGTAEVADILACSAKHARSLCRAGQLRAQRVGTTWTIRPEDLDAYRYGRRETAHGQPGSAPAERAADRS